MFTAEQREFISNELKDLFEIFGYCSKMKEGETEEDQYNPSDVWLDEQQSEFNFAKYAEISED